MPFTEIAINSEYTRLFNPTIGKKSVALGQKAIQNTIIISVVAYTGKGGYASLSSYLDTNTEEDGTVTSQNIDISYVVNCKDRVHVSGIYSGTMLDYDIYVPSSITVRVEWKTYIEPPPVIVNEPLIESPLNDGSEESITNETSSDPLQTREEIIDQMVLRREGLNVKCIDMDDFEKRGNTEVRGNENIINPMIKDELTAQRIGEYNIGLTSKNFTAEFSYIPLFYLKPGSFVEINIPQWHLNQVARVEGISIKNSSQGQGFNFSVKIKKETV